MMPAAEKHFFRRHATPAWVTLGCAVSLWAQQPPPPSVREPLRVEVQVVNVYCTVTDKKGGLVTDLAREDFEVREDGKRQTLRYFDRETDRPLTLALLVDTSISQQHVLPLEKETAALFLQRILRPVDLALLITFDVNVDLLQDFTSEAVRLERALGRARINAPSSLGPFPRTRPIGTRLFDALYLASVEKLAPEVGRRAIVVLSDGVDQGSQMKFKQVLEAAHRSETMIYAIVVADPTFYRQRGVGYPGHGKLAKLARETGGRTIQVDKPEKLVAAFDALAAELRSQYTLGYTPTNRRADGKFRKIKVKVKRKGLRVYARRGYYAPRPPTTPPAKSVPD
ncbi:MAG: VWA domain-containing protein [Terriglobia bacterium]